MKDTLKCYHRKRGSYGGERCRNKVFHIDPWGRDICKKHADKMCEKILDKNQELVWALDYYERHVK